MLRRLKNALQSFYRRALHCAVPGLWFYSDCVRRVPPSLCCTAGLPGECPPPSSARARLADGLVEAEGELGKVAGLAAQLERLQRPELQAGRLDAQAQARLHRARAGRLQAAQRARVCAAQRHNLSGGTGLALPRRL